MNGCLRIAVVLMAVVSHLPWFALGADESVPLHRQIDNAISAAHVGECAGIAADTEFVRRVYLDLIGRSPTAEECRAFLADESADKRSRLIDELLASQEFNDFFAIVLDINLMERRGGNRVPQNEWRAFLRRCLSEQQSLDRIVRTVLTADGTGATRGAAKFLLDREVESNALTRDISRIFLGRDLQCAQCHDHPNIGDYLQSEYYGIYAFINRSYLFQDTADNNKAYVGEKAEGGAEFQSVFAPDDDATPAFPHLLSGLALEAEPRLEHEQAYVTEPSKTAAGIPKFSRRGQLAWLITHPANAQFSRNAVNRLWAHMLGQGLVDPVDFDHSDNPPSHPALLDLLTHEFIAMGFDLRGLLREIALSETYQRSIEFPALENSSTLADIDRRSQVLVAKLESVKKQRGENKQENSRQSAGLESARERLRQTDEGITVVAEQISELDSQLASLGKAKSEKQAALATQQQQAAALQTALEAAKKVAELLPKDAQLAKTRDEYQTRFAALTKSIEAAKTELAENDQQQAAAKGKQQELRKSLARRKSERIVQADMVAEARGGLRVFAARDRQLLAQQARCEQCLAGLRQERDFLVAAKQFAAKSELLEEIVSTPPVSAAELAAAHEQRSLVAADIQQGQQLLDSLMSQTQENTELLAKKEAPLRALEQAIEMAQRVADELADGELEIAVEQLENKLAHLAEQLEVDRRQATELAEQTAAARERQAKLLRQGEQAVALVTELESQQTEYEQQVETARAEQQSASVALDTASAKRRQMWERRFVVRGLKPLTPEQLAGSTIAGLGLMARFEREAEAEWSKQNQDAVFDADNEQHQREVAALVDKRVAQVVATYVSLFAAPAGAPQDVFSSTADQALFLSNDGRVLNWLSASEGTLLGSLQQLGDLPAVVTQLYLAILSRPPTELEQAELVAALQSPANDRKQALRDVAWGLLASLEFRFNH